MAPEKHSTCFAFPKEGEVKAWWVRAVWQTQGDVRVLNLNVGKNSSLVGPDV